MERVYGVCDLSSPIPVQVYQIGFTFASLTHSNIQSQSMAKPIWYTFRPTGAMDMQHTYIFAGVKTEPMSMI